MFTSFSDNIDTIVRAVIENSPKINPRILDVGGAFGKYALLIREGIASIRSENGDLCPDISDIIIDNLDIAYYFDNIPWLKSLYNNCYKGDILQKYNICDNYDIILMIDVIEHIDKANIIDLFNKIKTPILVSTPKHTVMYEQEHYGFARHCSQWNNVDLQKYIKKDYSNANSWIFLICG